MANELRKLVQAVGAYLRFEQLCRRTTLFEEAYLSAPIGHFLMSRYGTRVQAEFPHAELAAAMRGPGRRPAVDYVALDANNKPLLAVEAKWLSNAKDILEQSVRDLIRLEMLVASYGCSAYFVLAGLRRRADALFSQKAFQPHPKHPNSATLLPLELGERRSIRIESPSKYRAAFMGRTLKPFDRRVLAAQVRVTSSGMSPEDAQKVHACVYGWRIDPAGDQRRTFTYSVTTTAAELVR